MNGPYTAQVVIVEDDEDDRLLMKEALRSIPDLRLRFMENGKEFLAYMRRNSPPDLIILDIEMPLFDGREALCSLHADGYSDIPVACLTTSLDETERAYCLERGAKEYIKKPSSFRELSETLHAVIRKWAFRFRGASEGETLKRIQV